MLCFLMVEEFDFVWSFLLFRTEKTVSQNIEIIEMAEVHAASSSSSTNVYTLKTDQTSSYFDRKKKCHNKK